jgi:tryptophanyl-tRNA synthetase
LTGQSRPAIEAHFAGKGYSQLKNEVAEVIVENLRPIRERYLALAADPGEIERILAQGAERARAVAEPKIEQIKRKVGFLI